MPPCIISLDESGDLGWSLNRPFQQGGSSRYLTIGALLTPSDARAPPKRTIKRLYEKHKWPTDEEKKWATMEQAERVDFARAAVRLVTSGRGIKLFAITTKKENVRDRIRSDPNKLYNYMIRLLLADEMAQWDQVLLVPDKRSIKVASGNSLHDYLSIYLLFEKAVETTLNTHPAESHKNRNLQFADMLAGLVQSHHERGQSDPWEILRPHITHKTLFF